LNPIFSSMDLIGLKLFALARKSKKENRKQFKISDLYWTMCPLVTLVYDIYP